MAHNILITALGGDIAQGVLKAVKLFSPDCRVVGTDKYASSAGLFMCQKSFVVRPAAGENPEQFVRRLSEICNSENIQLAFVCHEAEQRAVAHNIDYLNNSTKTYFVVQPLETLLLCQDKAATYEFLSQKGIRVPETCVDKSGLGALINKFGFPLIIKPRQSCGSKDLHLVQSAAEAEEVWSKLPGALAQEFITNDLDEEYTVGIFLDKDSRALKAIPMLRKLRFGLTWYAFVDDYPDIVETAVRAAEAVRAIGPCNVQLRRDRNNKPCVIEINARISSTAIFRAKLVFNEAGASIDYFLNNKTPTLDFQKGLVMKMWDELIIPLDNYRDLEQNNFFSNE